jgi:hypothetical protein
VVAVSCCGRFDGRPSTTASPTCSLRCGWQSAVVVVIVAAACYCSPGVFAAPLDRSFFLLTDISMPLPDRAPSTVPQLSLPFSTRRLLCRSPLPLLLPNQGVHDIQYHDTVFLASFSHVELLFEQVGCPRVLGSVRASCAACARRVCGVRRVYGSPSVVALP